MRELDHYTIHTLGVPSTLLMTNAAAHVALAACELLPAGGSIAVFCGSGNNGGDGVAAAVWLKKRFVPVRAFLVGSREKMTPDTAEMERRLTEVGGILEPFDPDSAELASYVEATSVIIDAMFGIGLNTDLRGMALAAVSMINRSPARVVAADIASGVEADTGRILGGAVRADLTVTFTLPKPGHFIEPGCLMCGAVRIADIGIPRELAEAAEAADFVVLEGDIALPKRKPDAHKGDFGRDLIIAGSTGYTGAPVLCASAASRAGAGLVFLGVPEAIYEITASRCSEVMPFPLPSDETGHLTAVAIELLLEKCAAMDVCLLGPGLGRSAGVTAVTEALLRTLKIPLVLDADGINAIAGNIDILDEASPPLILTPHPGEFQRLGGDLSNGDRLGAAKHFAKQHRCILVLKGHRTITAFPDGSAYVNTTGSPAMAKGGSGDVLAGIIASFVGQRFPLKDAVLAAVYYHGKAGDLCAGRGSEYAATADDLILALPEVLV